LGLAPIAETIKKKSDEATYQLSGEGAVKVFRIARDQLTKKGYGKIRVLASDCFSDYVQLQLFLKLLRLAVYSSQIALASPS
jgi:hypothetical protein